jgi:hypothetical protein
MFPAVDPADVEALTACIDYVAERVAYKPEDKTRSEVGHG